MLAPALQTSREPRLHGQFPLLPTIYPDLGWGETSRLYRQEILDGTAKHQLGGGETILRVRCVAVLHHSPGYLVCVRRAIRPGVIQEDPLGGLDGGLGPEVRVRVVGRTDPVFSHSPGLEETSQCL